MTAPQSAQDIIAEAWRSIPGYEGLYEASDRGRIRSLDRVVRTIRQALDGEADRA